MGLFTALILAPLQPVRGVGWVAAQVAAEADRIIAERNDPRRLLTQLRQARERGELTQEEFEEAEEVLLRRLTDPATVILGRTEPDGGRPDE